MRLPILSTLLRAIVFFVLPFSPSLGQQTATEYDRGEAAGFDIPETTIRQIHDAFRSGELTAVDLVNIYLKRIEELDKPNDMNAFLIVNELAVTRARELDEEFKQTGQLRPLHGIPVAVKDNYDTFDLQTTAGSIALLGSVPDNDSFMVKKLREAGAIIIGKTNMDEWAFSPLKTESSILGTTRNPYDLTRVPAGSSGGTAAAVAANLAAVGLGTDTGNSIRGPSAHCDLVGIRPTIGLTSRAGIAPLSLTADVGGPMCRSVEDASRVLSVVAGYDPADPATEKVKGRPAVDYTTFLDSDGLRKARIGVLRSYFPPQDSNGDVIRLMARAISDLQRFGAAIHDPFVQPPIPNLERRQDPSFRAAINSYLAKRGDETTYKTLEEIVAAGKYHSGLERRLNRIVRGPSPNIQGLQLGGPDGDLAREAFRAELIAAMDEHQLDAVIYPTWRYPPRVIGDLASPHGDNCQVLAPFTGMPAITVPMGFTSEQLPAGLQFLGRPFEEGRLISLAYAYEQRTKHRQPPALFDGGR